MSKSICIIPARGGSKRIHRKNIKSFLGKPIMAYSIEVALASKLFDMVVVSTDDTEIANVAEQYGAEVPFLRSHRTSDDFATTIDVLKEVLSEFEKLNMFFEEICVLYPTAPFVTVEKLKVGAERLINFDAALPVTAFSFPVWRSFKIEKDQLSYQWPKFEKSRSQDLETLYHDAGQWYFIRRNALRNSLVVKNTSPVIVSNLEVQDIDTEEDWLLAELKYEYLQSSSKGSFF